ISKDHLNYLDPKTIGGLNLYAYCAGNPVMYVDRDGHDATKFWAQLFSIVSIIGGAIAMFIPGLQGLGLGLIGFGVGSLIGGEISKLLGGSYLLGWVIGGILGAIGGNYLAASLGGFLSSSLTLGGGTLAFAGVGTVGAGTVVIATGAQLIGVGALVAGLGIMFSKSDPWKNTSPRSWLNKEDAIEALRNAAGDSAKATKDILDRIFGPGNWQKGSRDYNAVKKWIDRVIRAILGL
ncbi:MAG: hypothetical protein LBR37_00770, partial [Erysipelotrichaceae bacterium]|nr:hypothetical protein [Erysipelotrichaceae bacterium]